MPYRLRKSPKRDLYWVIGEDGTKHSKEPIPKERAEAQMKALYIAMRQKRGGAKFPRKIIYDSDSSSDSEPPKGRCGVSIPKNEFIREHERLIQLLQSGTPAQRKREAKSQAKELAMNRGGGLFSSIYKLCNQGVIPDAYVPEPFVPLPMRSRSAKGSHDALVAQVNKLVDNDREYQRHEEQRNPLNRVQNRGRGKCGGSNDPSNQAAELDALANDPVVERTPTELEVLEDIGFTDADLLDDDDIKMGPEFEKLPNSDKFGPVNDAFLQRMIGLSMKYINNKANKLTSAEKREQYQNIGQAKAFMKQRTALEAKLLRERAKEAAALKEAFDGKLKTKFVAPVYRTTEEMGFGRLGRGYGRMRGCGKEEDAARLISMFEEMKRKLEEARQPEPEPAVPDEDEETALVPDTSVHRPSSPGYDVIGRMMKPNEDGEAKKALKVSDKAKADAKAFAEGLRSAGLEESERQKLPLRLMALDTKDILLRGILMPQKGNEVKQEDIDKKINLLRRQVFEVGDPRQGLYEYRLEELIPELKYERTLSGRDIKDLILSTAEELERARRQEFPDYISSAKYKGFSGRGKSPYETPDVAKMMADARTRRKEIADERQRVKELEATMENWGFFVKIAMKNNMTPIYLAHLIVNKPDRFTEKMINRAKYVLRLSGYGYHGGSKEDWVVILNNHIADLKKETGSNKSKLEFYSTLKGLSDKMSYPQYDAMSKWLSEWQKKNKDADGYYNLDSLMSRLKDFWNSPLAGTFAVKPVTSPVKRMSEISEAIPENLKAWIEIKLRQKAEKEMRYMTPAEREADMARAMANTDRAILELNEATEAAKLRRENPEEANRREAEAKAKASAEQAARLRQFQLDTKKRIAERHSRFRPAGYL